ncbi:MAG: prepilin-type N-terminal cleavage/methylation domain-containing protein [Planctomycetes bacterium]|nr:prepilin-type N-terminal cleavage/methylation domain-containing protein [Planctomycetota bacterium]
MVRTVRVRQSDRPTAFTLIELLVVISIISLLISILLPSLSRARAQAKSLHCLAKLKDIGNALGAYENISGGSLPPALWNPDQNDLNSDDKGVQHPGGRPSVVEYGWTELLFTYLYSQPVRLEANYPVQRNLDSRAWQEYFICKAVGNADGVSSGHYRVYLPSWSAGSYVLDGEDRYDESFSRADPRRPASRDRIRPRLPLIGDANEESERGDGLGNDDCSFIDAGEADYAGSNGRTNGNRFSDRHYGGTNYLFQDMHGAWDVRLRTELARDYDLNSVQDIDVQP